MDNLNYRIQQMRKHLNLSQAEFGASGGVSQSTQNRFEQASTDVPVSYLNKIYETHKEHINKSWLFFGEGEMLNKTDSDSSQDSYIKIDNYFKEELTPQESRIIAEVSKFSNFLRTRPLQPEVKRSLLELLILSIDEAIDDIQNKGH